MENSYRIAVVNSSTFGVYHSDLLEKLGRFGEITRFTVDPNIPGDKLAAELRGEDFLIASVTPDFSEEFFNNQKDVKLIARHGIGHDNVDVEAATSVGVPVTRVLGSHERSGVAEVAVGLALDCLREFTSASIAVQEGQWDKRKEFVGREISRAKVGIIGYGNIGSRVAEIIREGFKAEVMAYDPNVARAVIEKNGIQPVALEELLRTADIISLNASLNKDNHQMLSEEEFKLMKDNVVIVNTARGQLINEQDLADALDSGEVGAAGLDVVQTEPIEPDNPLLNRDKVLIIPHIGGYSKYSLRKMDEKMVEDIEAVITGEIPEQVVNPEVFRNENRAGIVNESSTGR